MTGKRKLKFKGDLLLRTIFNRLSTLVHLMMRVRHNTVIHLNKIKQYLSIKRISDITDGIATLCTGYHRPAT